MSLNRWAPEINLWQRAKESTKGIRITFSSRGRAIHMAQRLYRARTAIRRDNESLPADNPLCGCSYYDNLSIPRPQQDENGIWYITIVPATRGELEVVDI